MNAGLPGAAPLSEPSTQTFNSHWAWALLLAASRHARAASPAAGHFTLGSDEKLTAVGAQAPNPALELRRDGVWVPTQRPDGEAGALLDLYLPLCRGGPVTVGHLGQSIDGYIATRTGDSSYVNGPENILHLHRMRALCDAVIVGAGTIAADDPRLTTREVAGPNPVRVILDPRLRLPPNNRVFTDGEAETFVICSADIAAERPRGSSFSRDIRRTEIIAVPAVGADLDLGALLETLHARGLRRIFVEGGGTTVSRFLEAGLLDRLQIAIAPLIVGSGRPGLQLPPSERIAECFRPMHRIFAMGGDVLFDCDLRERVTTVDRTSNSTLARIC
jgi:riboflavin-specific deaminase-like protein